MTLNNKSYLHYWFESINETEIFTTFSFDILFDIKSNEMGVKEM